ncbi:MAG: hypothetical protein HKL88_10345 [Bacteroidia bacterium]|nr:hypothetical protein [Bacteroidia bacterium]
MLPDNKTETAENIAEEYSKGFYNGSAEARDGGYYFRNGEVFVEVDNWQFISEEHFHVLKQYISVFYS